MESDSSRGILGVIVLRAIMIALGAALVSQFAWVLFIGSLLARPWAQAEDGGTVGALAFNRPDRRMNPSSLYQLNRTNPSNTAATTNSA